MGGISNAHGFNVLERILASSSIVVACAIVESWTHYLDKMFSTKVPSFFATFTSSRFSETSGKICYAKSKMTHADLLRRV